MDVSIIVPVYQVELYIEDCLRSVMLQTYQGEMECLIIDDCGADDSIAIAERVIAEYDGPIRFEIIHHEHNRGLSAARNTGIQRAKGDYLFFLDSDDWITEDSIRLLMKKVEEYPGVELVQGNAKVFPYRNPDDYTKTYSLLYVKDNKEMRLSKFGYDDFPAYSWNKLIKRSFVLEHDLLFKEGVLYEDNLWQFYLLKYLSNVSYVVDVTYIYKVRPKSIMTGTNKYRKAQNLGIIYHEIFGNLTPGYEKEEYDYYAKGFAKIYFRYAHACPMLKDVFRLCWEKGTELGTMYDRTCLTISYILEVACLGRLITALRKGR